MFLIFCFYDRRRIAAVYRLDDCIQRLFFFVFLIDDGVLQRHLLERIIGTVFFASQKVRCHFVHVEIAVL